MARTVGIGIQNYCDIIKKDCFYVDKSCYYGKKVIILLDEYDTSMQEAYVNGYFREGNEPSESVLSFGA